MQLIELLISLFLICAATLVFAHESHRRSKEIFHLKAVRKAIVSYVPSKLEECTATTNKTFPALMCPLVHNTNDYLLLKSIQ